MVSQKIDMSVDSLFALAPEPMIVVDPKGRVSAWSRSAERTFGWTIAEVLEMELPIVSPDHRQAFFRAISVAPERDEPARCQLEGQRKDGTPIMFRLSISALPDEEASGVLLLVTEVSEFSSGYASGTTPHSPPGVQHGGSPEHPSRTVDQGTSGVQHGGSLAHLHGTSAHGSKPALPHGEAGHTGGTPLVARDRFKQFAHFHTQLINMDSMWVSCSDVDGSVAFWNRGAEEISGYSSDEVIGGSEIWSALCRNPAQRADLEVRIRPRPELIGTQANFEAQIEDRSHCTRTLLLFVAYLGDGQGTPHGSVVFGTDITARLATEAALQETEKRYQHLVESSPVPIVVHAGERIVFANPAAAECLGAPMVAELLGKDIWGFVHPLSRARTQERVQAIYSKRKYARLEDSKLIRLDGREIDVEVGGTYADYQGEPASQVVFVDVTERKRSVKALREAYNIINMSPAVVFLWQNAEGWPVEFVTENVKLLFGYSAEDFTTGRVPYDKVVHRDDLERVAREVATYSNEQTRTEFTHAPYRIVRADGEVRWVDDRTAIRRDDSGRITHYQGIVVDITDQRRAEQALEQSELRFRRLAENAQDMIWRTDYRGKVEYVNEAVTRLFGYKREEAIGLPMDAYLVRESQDRLYVLVRRALASNPKVCRYRAELEYIHKNGQRVPCEVHASLLYDSAGRLVAAEGITRDISERRMAEKEKKVLEEQLRQSSKMEAVGRLAGGIAHDFNNLLTGIIGYTEIVSEGIEDDNPLLSDLLEIRNAAERAAELTHQLLAFGRKQVLQPKSIEINSVVAGMENILGRIIGEDIEMVIEMDDSPCSVFADPGQIEQVLLNLAANARDAMPDGGRLKIETTHVEIVAPDLEANPGLEPGRYVRLTVCDSGMGMDKDTLTNIFEPFFTTKHFGSGTGLGLSMVFGIIEQSGGHIFAASELGVGTTFTVYLPCLGKRFEPVPRFQENSPARYLKGSGTILVVEDDEMLRSLTETSLLRAGYVVLSARDGASALKASRGHGGDIDLILTDVVMPGEKGPVSARRILQERPATRVLYMSGYTEDAFVHDGVIEEGVAFLQKPFTVRELLKKVGEVLVSRPSSTGLHTPRSLLH